MKKVLVLLSPVLLVGCFICHKSAPQEEIEVVGIVEEQSPNVISRYSFSEIATFAFDSKEMNPDKSRMVDLMKDIQENPDSVIIVEGHTDNIGTEEYNKELSLDRAKVVAREIAKQNYPNQIRIKGSGAHVPLAPNTTAEGRAQNRRVDVFLIRDEK